MNQFHLISRQLFHQTYLQKTKSMKYQEVLKIFWEGDYHLAVDQISAHIASNPLDPVNPTFYRLWVESLWQSGDLASLRELKNHLLNLTREDGLQQESFAALTALCSVALDEWEYLQLLKFPIQRLAHSQWHEVYLLISIAKGQASDAEQFFAGVHEPVADFCHWMTLVKALYQAKNHRYLAQVLDYVVKSYDACPLRSLFYSLINLDSGNYRQAGLEIHEATQNYSGNLDYKLILAFAFARDGKLKDAMQVLDSLNAVMKRDLDVLSLRAYVTDELDKIPGKEGHYHEAAVAAYQDLILALQANNMPTFAAEAKLQAFSRTEKGEHSMSSQSWFLSLQLRDYHHVLGMEGQEEEFDCTVAKDIRHGDICFVGFRSLVAQNAELKIAAVCVAMTDAVRDPISGFRARLKLVFKPATILRIESVMKSQGRPSAKGASASWEGDCWKLSEDAFDAMFEPLVEDFSDQILELCARLEEINTPVAGYLNQVVSSVRKSS